MPDITPRAGMSKTRLRKRMRKWAKLIMPSVAGGNIMFMVAALIIVLPRKLAAAVSDLTSTRSRLQRIITRTVATSGTTTQNSELG